MLQINRERFLNLMQEQASIGRTIDGGLTRPSLFPADIEVRNWFQAQVEAHGLEYCMDGAGNQSGILKSDNPEAKTILLGSHLDSVPNGGRFDGALGVVAALEAVLSLKDAGEKLPFHLEVINFTDEEGTLIGLLGSGALAGLLQKGSLEKPRGGRDVLEKGMAAIGISDETILAAKRNIDDIEGYIEVHIEQGTRLEEAGLQIGVVTNIVGIRSMWIVFKGEAAHAGTKPMDRRKDAFQGAAEFSIKARARIMQDFHPGVVNFGDIQISPGSFNIVPAEVKLGVEFRHATKEQLDSMEASLLSIAEETAEALSLELSVIRMHDIQAADMAGDYVHAIEAACDSLQLGHKRLLSFAGHDAQSMAKVTKSVMYFVPSVDGISHNPAEFTSDDDCVHAANVMLQTILQLCS